MATPIKAFLALALACVVGACGPTRSQLFLEDNQRLQQSDAPSSDAGLEHLLDAQDVDAGADLSLDRNARFEWQQTLAGGGECGMAKFSGTHACTTTEGLSLQGIISFSLVPAVSGSGQLISPGLLTLVGTEPTTSPFWRAPLAGEAECPGGSLQAYAPLDQQLGLGVSPLVFQGPYNVDIQGQLSSDEQMFEGEIHFYDVVGGVTCDGWWTARRTP